MKIQISLSEVTAILIRKYELPENTVVEIVESYPDLPLSVTSVFNAVESLRYFDNEKIAAIKAFRQKYVDVTGGGVGLADSKYVVENWDLFKSIVRKYGRLLSSESEWNEFRSQRRL